MFGSANILTVILEVKHGDIYNPTTLEKIDVITKRLTETKGVVPYQILSIAHPKMKSITTYGGAIQVREVFVITVAALAFLLWNYFRTWTGIWVPVFSGLLSSVWALGMGPLLGLNLDPLVLVVPIFLSARALSHSVQSMDRYHEEYHRLGDKHAAIVESYSHLFPPAIASVLSDGIGIMLVSIAPIPLIQKIAVFSSFWIVSIIVSVVTLHPIILSVINPPGVHEARYPAWSRWLGRGLVIAGAAPSPS